MTDTPLTFNQIMRSHGMNGASQAGYSPPIERAYSIQNGAVMVIREEPLGGKVCVVGTLVEPKGPLHFPPQNARLLRDALLKEFPLTLEEINALTPSAVAERISI